MIQNAKVTLSKERKYKLQLLPY